MYGPNAWRTRNYLLEETAKQAEKALEELKQRTTDINRERKNFQVGLVFIIGASWYSLLLPFKTQVGNQLTSLENKWTELISSILQIEMANMALDAEVDRLNKREAELASM